MDDRDFMDMMYQGFTKTTRAEDAYWGFEETQDVSIGWFYEEDPVTTYTVFAQTKDEKIPVGVFLNEADAAFVTAVAGSFPDIHRRWLAALDEADQKDLEKDLAEGVAAELSERLSECERNYARAEVTEDWYGKAGA